jgi:hypothetical protein
MNERSTINYAAVVADIGRKVQDDRDQTACEVAVDTLMFLADECEDRDCEPGPAAHLAILDLAAAIIAFGGVRTIDDLAEWLRKEAPARARELIRAVAASEGAFSDIPPCSCLGTPEPASWH